MHIESIIMAEGLAQDAEGVFSIIRVGQNVVRPRSFPAQTKRAVAIQLAEDEGESIEGQSFELAYSVVSPTGEVLMAQTAGFQVGEKLFKQLPTANWIPAELILSLNAPGEHRINAVLRQNGEVLDQASLSLYVISPES